jgi:hypothetical protein
MEKPGRRLADLRADLYSLIKKARSRARMPGRRRLADQPAVAAQQRRQARCRACRAQARKSPRRQSFTEFTLDMRPGEHAATIAASPRRRRGRAQNGTGTLARWSADAQRSRPPTLELAEALIACRSVTPDDGGCQALLAARLAPLGFTAETIAGNGVTNLWLRRGAGAGADAGASPATPTSCRPGRSSSGSDPFVPTTATACCTAAAPPT